MRRLFIHAAALDRRTARTLQLPKPGFAILELGRDPLQRRLALRHAGFTPLERRAAKLNCSELTAPLGQLALGRGQSVLTPGELDGKRVELSVPLVELRRSPSQQLLDRRPQFPRTLFAFLQVGDGCSELLGAQLELASAGRDQLLDRGFPRRSGVREERSQPVTDAVVVAAPRPVLPLAVATRLLLAAHPVPIVVSVRRRGRPSAVEFGADPAGAPCDSTPRWSVPALITHSREGGVSRTRDKKGMDANGARLLAARIRAGVRIGDDVELLGDDAGAGLHAGDRGVVSEISDEGNIVVAWDRGFSLEIDPVAMPVRRAA